MQTIHNWIVCRKGLSVEGDYGVFIKGWFKSDTYPSGAVQYIGPIWKDPDFVTHTVVLKDGTTWGLGKPDPVYRAAYRDQFLNWID